MSQIYSYRELIVWQKAKKLAIDTYRLTEHYPASELYGLTAQMRRSAVSIASNIAEGQRRQGKKEFKQFLSITYGSGAELETQADIAKELGFGKGDDYQSLEQLLVEVMKMLNKMLQVI